MDLPAVPRRWPESVVCCIGGGPSLTSADVLYASQSNAKIVAVNDAYRMARAADVVFASDVAWWKRSPVAQAVPAMKYALPPHSADPVRGVTVLGKTGQSGLETRPWGLRTGGHSGYAAINLAFHLGAAVIVLLGYDMQPDADGKHHWFGAHPDGSHPRYGQWLGLYEGLRDELTAQGVRVVNASRQTALTSVPRGTLESVLCG